MDKSPDAFRTISEVAEHLETPAHVLRFWESRFPQIRPVKRAGGRRYYRPSDVSLLMGIKRLLHDEGLTIRGVQKILREQGVRHVAGLSGEVMGDDPDAQAPFVEQIEDAVVVTVAQLPVSPPTPGLTEAMAKAVDHRPQIGATRTPSAPRPAAEPAQGTLRLTAAPPLEFEFRTAADIPDAGPAEQLKPGIGHGDGDGEPDRTATLQASQQDAQVGAEPPGSEPPVSEHAASEPPASEHAASEPPASEPPGSELLASEPPASEPPASEPPASEHAASEPLASEPPESAQPESEQTTFPDSFADADGFDDDDFDDAMVATLAARIRALPVGASAQRIAPEFLAIASRLQSLRARMADAAQPGRS